MAEERSVRGELATIRDDMRVRAHLFGMEAKQSWQKLEVSLEQLEQRLQRGSEQLSEAVAEAASAWVASVREFALTHAGLEAPGRLVMTSPVATCELHESVNRVAQLFWDTGCGCAPVVDESGCLQGMLTDRDIAMAAYTQGRLLEDIEVASAMSRVVHAISPDESLARVLEIMADARVHHVPVVDAARHVVGLISTTDLACWVKSSHGDRELSAAVLAAFTDISLQLAPGERH